MEPITAAIREIRKHFGQSQEAFADRLGLSLRALASYESGDRAYTAGHDSTHEDRGRRRPHGSRHGVSEGG